MSGVGGNVPLSERLHLGVWHPVGVHSTDFSRLGEPVSRCAAALLFFCFFSSISWVCGGEAQRGKCLSGKREAGARSGSAYTESGSSGLGGGGGGHRTGALHAGRLYGEHSIETAEPTRISGGLRTTWSWS